MKSIIECPYCDGQAGLIKTPGEFIFKKETFKVIEHFYVCKKCNEEFTNTEVDTITVSQARNQYREKYDIIFPEEIAAIRTKYNLSAAKMSEILGFGPNGYSNYENGEMPTIAYSKLIRAASTPSIFLTFLDSAKENFSTLTYEKIKKNVQHIIYLEGKPESFINCLNEHKHPNNYTGYTQLKPDKLGNILSSFLTKCNSKYNDKLKINKLLFYLDFAHYKNHASSITGISYRAIQYGPVPTFYDNIFSYFENEGLVVPVWRNEHGAGREILTSSSSFDESLFNEKELATINLIIEKFKDMGSWDIVELSHLEKAWIELKDNKEIISYQKYAFDLIGV